MPWSVDCSWRLIGSARHWKQTQGATAAQIAAVNTSFKSTDLELKRITDIESSRAKEVARLRAVLERSRSA